jgi:hypothetical protein
VKRIRALTLALLPVEVDAESINSPTSRVITPQVIATYKAAAGDYEEAVCFNRFLGYMASHSLPTQLPYCLLRARAEFMWDANHDVADYGENHGRGELCFAAMICKW